MRLCSVEGCGSRHLARGWCNKHWKRWRQYGDPLAPQRPPVNRHLPPDYEVRDMGYQTPCWMWLKTKDPDGYGRTDGKHGHSAAHRRYYAENVAPIPEGHEVDHLCRVRACVRPDHLEAVTRQENCRRRGEFVRQRREGEG